MSVSDLKTQKHIRQLLKGADAHGWQARRGDRNWVAMALYVYDIATGFLATAVLNAEEFTRVATKRDQMAPEKVWEDAGTMIAAVADGKVPMHLQADAMNRMFYLANRYAGITQTHQVRPVAKGSHFFVLLYRRLGDKTLTLRPFATHQPGVDGVLDAETVRGHIRTVIAIDRERRPEWLLPAAEIIPFPSQAAGGDETKEPL